MQTLLIISFWAFVATALVWFGTWAFWLHPPEGWLGKDVVSALPLRENAEIRRAAWFRWLRIVTVLLGSITLALLAAMVVAHSR